MQYKPETEKVAMTDVAYMAVPKPLLLTEDLEIQRTRKILLIILGVCLALGVLGTITTISAPQSVDGTRRGSQAGSGFISMLYYAFGIFVAYRYLQTGLRVFAILGIISFVLTGIAIVLLLFVAVGALAMLGHAGDKQSNGSIAAYSAAAVIFVLVLVAHFVLTVIIVKLAFKLARLVATNQQLTTAQA